MLKKNDIVVFHKFIHIGCDSHLIGMNPIARVNEVNEKSSSEMKPGYKFHQRPGNVEIEYLTGEHKGSKAIVWSSDLVEVNHESYQKIKNQYLKNIAVLDEAMLLYHETRAEY